MNKNYIEIFIHLLFWIFLFSAVNVDWGSDWLDRSIRPKKPAPLSVLIFPIYFYVNVFILIPRYFSSEKWKYYILFAGAFFIIPEMIRLVIYFIMLDDVSLGQELFSRDSFLLGSPNVFFFALNLSFLYRFIRDRLVKKKLPIKTELEEEQKKTQHPYENVNLLSQEEIESLTKVLDFLLRDEEVFLDSDLTLRQLSEKLGSTEKKISYLINQELDMNFYELMNHHRIEKFKTEVAKPENDNLSIVGMALNCGFPSKSSFYRAFKSQVGMSPSEYIKKTKKSL